MRTVLSPDNPFGYYRFGFAWEMVEGGIGCHLDFGCHDGAFLESLAKKNIARRIGVDASGEVVEQTRRRLPELELHHLAAGAPIPAADASVDSISMMDVLEHVHRQEELLRDLHRVLRRGGRLIVTVPKQHVFSFLDLGNLKFRFPRLHRFFYCLNHSREEYQRRYVDGIDGLIGDISVEKRWHEHFSEAKMEALLGRCGFEIERFDGSALFGRWLILAMLIGGRVPVLKRIIRRIESWDSRRFESMNLFCVARKV